MSGHDVVCRAVGPVGATATGDDGWFAGDALRRASAARGIGPGAPVEQACDGKPHGAGSCSAQPVG